MTRTVTKLLRETYAALGQTKRDEFIQPTLLQVWVNSGSGEAVAAEAMVALELASKDLMRTKRMTFSRLEDTDPDMIKPLFEAAIIITEKPKAVSP